MKMFVDFPFKIILDYELPTSFKRKLSDDIDKYLGGAGLIHSRTSIDGTGLIHFASVECDFAI